jgi:hypothetical protein
VQDTTRLCKEGEVLGLYYLISLKGPQQAGLTGLKGSIVRKVAVDKTPEKSAVQ